MATIFSWRSLFNHEDFPIRKRFLFYPHYPHLRLRLPPRPNPHPHHDLHRLSSTSLNLGTVASMIHSEISCRCWRELDTPTTLTITSAALEERYLPHVQTPWTNHTAQAARSLGIPMNGLILEIEDYAKHFTNSTVMALPRQPSSIEVLVEKGYWERLAQHLARDMLLADITFKETEDRMNRLFLKEAIQRYMQH